jgi:hypothetical protein
MWRMIASAGQMQALGDEISHIKPTLTPSPSSFLKLDVALLHSLALHTLH